MNPSLTADQRDAQDAKAIRRVTAVVWIGCILSAILFAASMGWLAFHNGSRLLMAVLGVAYPVAIGGWTWFGFRQSRKLRPGPKMPASMKRYMWRFLPSMALYTIGLIVSLAVYQAYHPHGWVAVLVAILPAAPTLAAIYSMGALLVEMEDEFQRAVMTESYVLATGMTVSLCTLWGFLEMYQLVPHIQLWAVFPLLAICLLPAGVIVRLKRR